MLRGRLRLGRRLASGPGGDGDADREHRKPAEQDQERQRAKAELRRFRLGPRPELTSPARRPAPRHGLEIIVDPSPAALLDRREIILVRHALKVRLEGVRRKPLERRPSLF